MLVGSFSFPELERAQPQLVSLFSYHILRMGLSILNKPSFSHDPLVLLLFLDEETLQNLSLSCCVLESKLYLICLLAWVEDRHIFQEMTVFTKFHKEMSVFIKFV